MKKYFLIITLICIGAVAYAQEKIYSIVTCPTEDPSQSMNISWAAEEEGSYVLYAPANDKNWKNCYGKCTDKLLFLIRRR